MQQKLGKEDIKFFIEVSTSLLILSLLFFTFFNNVYVPTGSMEPTISPQDRFICLRTNWCNIQRGDIVCFDVPPASGDDACYCKRVIGLPGETVDIRGGKVYIDDVLLEEDYIVNDDYNGTYIVPKGEYFMMGDNRPNSYDSRYWGTVPADSIKYKIVFCVFSVDNITHLGFVK